MWKKVEAEGGLFLCRTKGSQQRDREMMSTFSLSLRGSQVMSRLTFPSMMQPLHYFPSILLCSLSFLSSVLSIQCNEKQYPWPPLKPEFCCNMCPPGKHLVRRLDDCQIECDDCEGKRYMDTYTKELTCKFCKNCDRPSMEYKSNCNSTHNAECRCKSGYECKEKQPCTQCVPIPTTKPTLPPSTTANMEYKSDCNSTHNAECRCKSGYECKEKPCKQCVPIPTTKPTLPPSTTGTDAAGSLVIIGLLSAGIAVILVTKIKPFLHWIRSKHGSLMADSCPPVAPCSEDEEVSRPVQEAGNVPKLKSDPEIGLCTLLQTNIQ
ncbi:CD27 antigen-like isoform X3 [Antennarius striatus]|uniref:CD27 antigen-like isoform X3 n=1 Tax=Antennarius striatus TaxID=241820 RepID=UPI0035ADF3DB